MFRKLIALCIVLVSVSGAFYITGCEKEGPVEEGAEETKEAVEEGAEETKEAVE